MFVKRPESFCVCEYTGKIPFWLINFVKEFVFFLETKIEMKKRTFFNSLVTKLLVKFKYRN